MELCGKCVIKDKKIVHVNKMFLNHIKESESQLINKDISNIISDKSKLDVEEILEHGKENNVTLFYQNTKNQILELQTNVFPMDDYLILSTKNLISSEVNISTVFDMLSDLSGIGVIQQDFTEPIKMLEDLVEQGHTDLRKYFYENVDKISEFHSKIQLQRINNEIVNIFEGSGYEEVFDFLNVSRKMTTTDYIDSMIDMYYIRSSAFTQKYTKIKTIKTNIKEILLKSKMYDLDKNLYINILVDLTALKEVERKFKESELRFEQLFQELAIGLLLVRDGIIIECNQELANTFGYDHIQDVIGNHMHHFTAPSDRERVSQMHAERTSGKNPRSLYTILAIKKNGIEFPAEIFALRIVIDDIAHSLGIVTDISERLNREKERERLQNQLISSHKLESLGILSGGIAHDFNNILTVIEGGLDILGNTDDLSNFNKELVSDLFKTSRRAANLINQLLIYTGKAMVHSEIVSLSSYFNEIESLLRLAIPNNIEIVYNRPNNDYFIKIDKTQFTQVLMNLSINSAESIDRENGKITISCRSLYVPSHYNENPSVFRNKSIIPCEYIEISVTDNGTGISEDDISKIFDPFYSRKPGGRGLGLSVVQGIIFQNNGFIKIASDIGTGTRMSIYLPITTEVDKISSEQVSSDFLPNIIEGSILICDDEIDIQKVLGIMVKSKGIEVLFADNGEEAIEVYKNNTYAIKLVILDLSMPVMSGQETLEQLKLLNPSLPILIISGYPKDELEGFDNYTMIDFLQKPFSSKDLYSRINSLQQRVLMDK